MENINALVKTIIAISFMWSIAESVLPDSTINKYTKYIYGLVIMSILVSAIMNFSHNDLVVDYSVLHNSSEYTNEYVRQVYETNLEKILSEKFNNADIDVTLDKEYKIKSIICPDSKTYEEIMGYIYE